MAAIFRLNMWYVKQKYLYKKSYEYISLIFLQCVGREYAHMPVKLKNPIIAPNLAKSKMAAIFS